MTVNTSKRYAVIESSDLTRNMFWLASCFSQIKKPNRHCLGNQSVIPCVCIIDTTAASMRAVFHLEEPARVTQPNQDYFAPLSFVHLYVCGDAASTVHTILT